MNTIQSIVDTVRNDDTISTLVTLNVRYKLVYAIIESSELVHLGDNIPRKSKVYDTVSDAFDAFYTISPTQKRIKERRANVKMLMLLNIRRNRMATILNIGIHLVRNQVIDLLACGVPYNPPRNHSR